MKRLAVLISGGGSNMQSIIDATKTGMINGEVVLVISSNHDAGGLERAKGYGIPCYVCAQRDFESSAARDERILQLLNEYRVDLVVLAGYLGIVTARIVDNYTNRIINIHPSLLPKYGGKSFFGLRVHQAVLAGGETESGATVHYVDSGTDTGKIIRQQRVPVLADDTPEQLQQRVLAVEHQLLVQVIKELCQ